MRKLEVKDAKIMRIAVQQEILRSEESRYNHRLHGILLVCSGLSCPEVAKLLGHGPRTIQYWVRRFEKSGFAGLEVTPRPGRPSLINEDIRNGACVDLRCSPREFGYSQNLWDSKLLSYHLFKKYGVQLGERQCRRFFHHLGFRQRKPWPVIAKADQEAQLRHKKT
ncbi:MAG: winged helix-turn-helix domain-containing protein [Thermodesulfobacteriota bacterium]|nr:winged helix-turn-helix domain-containing protein [Thermodesulfobacteriota bacterium]